MKRKAVIDITVPGYIEDVRDSIVVKEFRDVLSRLGIKSRVCTSLPGWHKQNQSWIEFNCNIIDYNDNIILDLKPIDPDDQDLIDDFYEAIKWGKIVMMIHVFENNDLFPYN
jgi:hypothetical protein